MKAPIRLLSRWMLLCYFELHGWNVEEAKEELHEKLSEYVVFEE